MTTFHLRLGDEETALLGQLANANPGYLFVANCDPIALSNLVAIGCAGIGGERVWISGDGVALWGTRVPREGPDS